VLKNDTADPACRLHKDIIGIDGEQLEGTEIKTGVESRGSCLWAIYHHIH